MLIDRPFYISQSYLDTVDACTHCTGMESDFGSAPQHTSASVQDVGDKTGKEMSASVVPENAVNIDAEQVPNLVVSIYEHILNLK